MTATRREKNNSSTQKKEAATAAWIFLFPALACLCVWFVYPLIQSFIISFQDFNYMFADRAVFVGFQNYVRIFQDPDFWQAFWHSISFVIMVVPIQTILALLLAVLVDGNFKGKGFFRTAFYTPYVLSSVAVATVFMYFFVKGSGLVNLLSLFGLKNVTWFADVHYAMPFIALMYIWQLVGFYMIYFLSGLQTISPSLYEAAEIDGANKIDTFLHITIPSLKPTIFLVLTYGIIQAFQLFDQISVVTAGTGGLGSPAGATDTLLTYFYKYSFEKYQMGYGSAVAIVIFLIIMAVTLIQQKASRPED